MTRKEQLKAMDNFIRTKINDESLIYSIWLVHMPDGADEYDYEEIAEDEELFNDCLDAFMRCFALDK